IEQRNERTADGGNGRDYSDDDERLGAKLPLIRSASMFDPKEFCAKSLVVVGVVTSIPAVGSALVALLYCWILWPPSAMNASNYMACLSWLAFVGFGIFLVVKWGRFARELDTSRGSTWLWIISAGYCGIVLL